MGAQMCVATKTLMWSTREYLWMYLRFRHFSHQHWKVIDSRNGGRSNLPVTRNHHRNLWSFLNVPAPNTDTLHKIHIYIHIIYTYILYHIILCLYSYLYYVILYYLIIVLSLNIYILFVNIMIMTCSDQCWVRLSWQVGGCRRTTELLPFVPVLDYNFERKLRIPKHKVPSGNLT